MNLNDVLNVLNMKSDGSSVKVKFRGDLPLNAQAKRDGISAVKITEAILKKGLKYSELDSTKQKISEGYELSHTLPWGQWKEGYENLIIEHKGSNYVRLYAGDEKANTKYIINDKEVDYNTLKDTGCLVNSFFNKKEGTVETMTLKIDNIISIE